MLDIVCVSRNNTRCDGVSRRDFLRVGAPHPGRRPRSRLILFSQWLVLIRRRRAWRQRRNSAPRSRRSIVLANQASEFGKRVGIGPLMLIAATAKAIGAERSVLVSISHRDDVFPSGKPPPSSLQASRPLPDAPTRMQAAITPDYRISSGAWTPRMASPDAKTKTTP